MSQQKPKHLDLKKDKGLHVTWADDSISFYPIDYLRKHSPSADNRVLQEQMDSNPFTVLPTSMANAGPVTAVNAEMVGNYAIRITFSDGHHTGLFSWDYLRKIDPNNAPQDTA